MLQRRRRHPAEFSPGLPFVDAAWVSYKIGFSVTRGLADRIGPLTSLTMRSWLQSGLVIQEPQAPDDPAEQTAVHTTLRIVRAVQGVGGAFPAPGCDPR